MLYVHPDAAGIGVGALLIDALERLARARGTARLTASVSDTAEDFFKKRGFVAQSRASLPIEGEWLANTIMRQATWPRPGAGEDFAMTRAKDSLFSTRRCATARRRRASTSRWRTSSMASLLDRLGIDYVEGGYPGANPLDTTFFERSAQGAKFTAFGMTKRAGRSAANDPGVAALLDAGRCHLLRREGLGLPCPCGARPTLEENLEGIRESVAAARERGARPWWIASTFSTATRPTGITRSPAPGRRTRPARAGSCSATPMAARCRTRSRASWRTCRGVPGDPRHPCP